MQKMYNTTTESLYFELSTITCFTPDCISGDNLRIKGNRPSACCFFFVILIKVSLQTGRAYGFQNKFFVTSSVLSLPETIVTSILSLYEYDQQNSLIYSISTMNGW